MSHAPVDITKTVRTGVPSLPYEKVAHAILGHDYMLSLVICGDALARRLNTEYRKKTYSPNVLSFPLSEGDGEIILNVRKAAREARSMGVSVRERVALLFVHGCLHLKGLDHGARMERLEEKYVKMALR